MEMLSTVRYQQAMELHAQIMASGSTAARALVEFARLLKKMKDERLYEAFDVSFDEYVETQVGIKKRQAYTYISAFEKLGAPMMEANAGLGITKLELLAQVSPIEREDVLEEHDLGAMSTAEVKQLVDELNHKGTQLTFALEENERLKEAAKSAVNKGDAELEELKKQLDDLKEEIAFQRSESARLAAKAKTDAAVAQAKAVKEAVSKAVADAKAKTKKEIDAACEKAAAEAEQKARTRYEDANKNNEELRSEIEILKKKMSIAGNQDAAIVSSYCKTVLAKVLNELVGMIEKAAERDQEQGSRLASAAASLLENAREKIAGMGGAV